MMNTVIRRDYFIGEHYLALSENQSLCFMHSFKIMRERYCVGICSQISCICSSIV